MQCTAKSKQSGQRCKKDAVEGYKVCHIHGGKSPKGEASATYKTGMHSKYLPAKLGAIYEGIEHDLEANVLSRNIRLREALIREKLSLLEDAPDSQEIWDKLRKQVDAIQKDFGNENYGGVTVGFIILNRLIDDRQAYHMALQEVRKDLNEQRNDTQAKAAITLKGESAISVNELMAFVGALMNLISTTVSNQDERNKIYHAIDRLTRVEESPSLATRNTETRGEHG